MKIHPYVLSAACLFIAGCVTVAQPPPAQTHGTVHAADLGDLHWRTIGPAVMGGRLDAVAGVPGDANTIYLGHSSGGLYKSTDGGMSFNAIFDAGRSTSIGAIALAPSNPKIVYIGTGEGFPRNTAALGDGVYRSDDAGKTWRSLGLAQTLTLPRSRSIRVIRTLRSWQRWDRSLHPAAHAASIERKTAGRAGTWCYAETIRPAAVT